MNGLLLLAGRVAITVELYLARWHRRKATGGQASLRVSWRYAV